MQALACSAGHLKPCGAGAEPGPPASCKEPLQGDLDLFGSAGFRRMHVAKPPAEKLEAMVWKHSKSIKGCRRSDPTPPGTSRLRTEIAAI